jgi:hypothetical protein
MRFTGDRALGPGGASRHALVARAGPLEYFHIFAERRIVILIYFRREVQNDGCASSRIRVAMLTYRQISIEFAATI